MNLTKTLRVLCIVVAVAVVLIPAAIAGITGNGFSETASHVFTSISILALMGCVLLTKTKKKNGLISKLAACAGLLYVLISQWI